MKYNRHICLQTMSDKIAKAAKGTFIKSLSEFLQIEKDYPWVRNKYKR